MRELRRGGNGGQPGQLETEREREGRVRERNLSVEASGELHRMLSLCPRPCHDEESELCKMKAVLVIVAGQAAVRSSGQLPHQNLISAFLLSGQVLVCQRNSLGKDQSVRSSFSECFRFAHQSKVNRLCEIISWNMSGVLGATPASSRSTFSPSCINQGIAMTKKFGLIPNSKIM